MKKNLIKILLLVIALSTIVALSSCDILSQYIPGLGNNDGKLPPEVEGELLLIHNSKALFNVVYTQTSGSAGKKAADTFVKDLRNLGVTVNDAISDRNAEDVTECEIIIGANVLNRGDDCCITTAMIGSEGRMIKIVGKRVIIAGGTPELTAKTFDVYVKNQMKISSKLTSLETLSVDSTYTYADLTKYPIESIKIGDTNLGDFTLVYDIDAVSADNYSVAKLKTFASSIFSKSGIVFETGEIAKVDSYKHALIIRYVDTFEGGLRNRDHELEVNGGFRAYIDGNNYIIECCYKSTFERDFVNYVEEVFTSQKGKVVISKDYSSEANVVTYEEYGAKGNGTADDYKALYDTHVFANQCGQTVKGKKGAHYYVGPASLVRTIPVKTNVDFNGATITVNDVGPDAYDKRETRLFTTVRQDGGVTTLTGDEVYALYAEYRKTNPGAPENLVIDMNTESFPWLASKLEVGSMVRIISSKHKDFVRHGANQNSGTNRMDVFMVEANGDFVRETDTDLDGNGVIGNVTTPVAYSFGSTDYENDPSVTRTSVENGTFDSTITQLIIYRNDDEPITIKNGIFYNICCQTVAETDFKVVYKAHYRGFELFRSNVTIENIKHRMKDEPEMGTGHEGHKGYSTMGANCDDYCPTRGSRRESYPYYGFFFIQFTSNLTIKDCNITGHTVYYEDKPSTATVSNPAPVPAGSYDFVVERSCNVSFYNVVQGFYTDTNTGKENDTGLGDQRYWGIMSSNGSKNMWFEGCAINRFDAHQGFWNATLKDTTIGHSINVVGGGTLNLINVTKITGDNGFMALRGDYGGTFRGDMNIIDCTYNNYASYNTNKGTFFSTTVRSTGIIIHSGFAQKNDGYRTLAERQESYNKTYEKTYKEKMEGYEKNIAEGTITEAQAMENAKKAATTAAEKMFMQGGYWLWDFGYDCYLPTNVTFKNFQSPGTTSLYIFPPFSNSVFTYNYDPENENAGSVTNVFNITKKINFVDSNMPSNMYICSATNGGGGDYSMLYEIPIEYNYTWVNPFE